MAAAMGNVKVVEFLLGAGANPAARSNRFPAFRGREGVGAVFLAICDKCDDSPPAAAMCCGCGGPPHIGDAVGVVRALVKGGAPPDLELLEMVGAPVEVLEVVQSAVEWHKAGADLAAKWGSGGSAGAGGA